MWTVKSEAGRLRAVLVQESIEYFWEKKLPFVGIESNSLYLARCPHANIDGGKEQWNMLPHFLEDEGVKVFEVVSILEKVLDSATIGERREIVKRVWEGMPIAPHPEELILEHLLTGYPSRAYYDEDADKVVLPDFQRLGWPYPRDTSFTTQVGTVICNMRRYSRRFEPRIVRLCYEHDPVLLKETELIWDANEVKSDYTEPSCIEGGDTHIIDEETIAIGVGQRSTFTGFIETAKRLFDADTDGELRHILAVRMPDYPASDYMHLDVVINYPAPGKALVMPYFFESELVKDLPTKRLLLKTLEAARAQSEADDRPMAPLVHPCDFRDAGSCNVYAKGDKGPTLVRREVSLVDYLIKEGKIDPDGIIYVGGRSETDNDMSHLMRALMEQARGAPNIVVIKPGLVIAYERNHETNEALTEAGVRVKEWEDSYLDLLGGPHCSTSPLWRDPL
ncbi:MAG: arginine deiminase family protein [Candidatus Bathyarchaeota archaeon]|jgi:N-dimethylarginine dimethylaminohydrolase